MEGWLLWTPAGREWGSWLLEGGLLKDLTQPKTIRTEYLPVQVLEETTARETTSLASRSLQSS